MTTTTKPLILVDGSSYLFRAFHALPPLTNSRGEATGAMHGVLNMLDKLRKDYEPDLMAVVFDASGKTFRDDLYPDYKANRPPMPDELRSQFEPLLEIIRAQGYPLLMVSGVEADDVIGTLASEHQGTVLISTSDKDMAQLVDERVHLINTMSNTYADPAGIIEKFGVRPDQIRDYLALMGDTVDNVPGVEKVGPKTAAKWISEYGSLENIMANADKFGGKVGENLRAALAHLPLSYQLVTIKCDVQLELEPDDLKLAAPNNEQLRELYKRYEFSTRLRSLDKATTPTTKKPVVDNFEIFDEIEPLEKTTIVSSKVEYQTIFTQEALEHWLQLIREAGEFSFDTETTSLNYMEAEIVGLSFAIQAGKAAYLPLAHNYLGAPPQLNRDTTLAFLKPYLEDEALHKIGQNLKYDRNVLLNHGIELKGLAHDTMLESYVLDSNEEHGMDSLCEKHLNHTTIHFEDIAGKGKKQLTFNQVGIEQASTYAAEDADMTLRLHQYFWPQLQALDDQRKLYQSLEMPLIRVLSTMERTGVKIDAKLLAQQSQELEQRLSEMNKQAYELAGQAFNLNSPKQLQEILFDKLGLPIVQKTSTGQASTDVNVLEELADQGHELPKLLLEYRSLSKLKSTYTDKLPEQINPKTGRVHTSYQQTGAATGRLSSTDPNLQNIPIRSEEGRRIRRAFIAEPGYKLLALDYSQIELRIMAHLSGDKGLLDAFAQGKDIHRATAAEVFNTPLDKLTNDQRRAAKAINFGLIYGMSAFGLARQLGIDRSEAQLYVNLYFARYPDVKAYMERTREQAQAQAYVETLFGRRLFLPEIRARNAQRRQAAERAAINAPMQGTAADIIKRAMISVDAWLRNHKSGARMILQVHDELVFEVPEAELAETRQVITELMVHAATLSVPLLVESGVGENWEEAH